MNDSSGAADGSETCVPNIKKSPALSSWGCETDTQTWPWRRTTDDSISQQSQPNERHSRPVYSHHKAQAPHGIEGRGGAIVIEQDTLLCKRDEVRTQ